MSDNMEAQGGTDATNQAHGLARGNQFSFAHRVGNIFIIIALLL